MDLPIDGDGVCMSCKKTPKSNESLTCRTCATPWHVPCLSSPPRTLAAVPDWLCPDCSPLSDSSDAASAAAAAAAPIAGSDGGLVSAIRAIEADDSLTEKEKAKKRQELMSGKGSGTEDEETEEEEEEKADDVMGLLDDKFKCSFCMQLPERPVTVSNYAITGNFPLNLGKSSNCVSLMNKWMSLVALFCVRSVGILIKTYC